MPPVPNRRSALRIGIGMTAAAMLPFGGAIAGEPPHDVTFAEDFDELWRTLNERYCFFGEKRTDWPAVRRMYRPQAEAARSSAVFAQVVARVLRELYDAHTYLHDAPADGQRGPYFDLWIEPNQDETARITSVKDGSAAADVGIMPGTIVTAINGQPIARVAATFMPRCLSRPDPAATAFALNIAVSGQRAQARTLILQDRGGVGRAVHVPVKPPVAQPDVESRILPQGFGYIDIRSFADDAAIEAFDAALVRFRDTPGLVIDVRQNGGGDTAVARPIMGRFITERKSYARMRRREGQGLSEPWTEMVDPRGPFTYTAPVAILTTRWSASMAEGFPMGMRGIGRGTIIGTPMMRVGAGVFPLRLDRTGLQLQYSAEPVYDVNDRPRWLLEPDVSVEAGADIVQAAIHHLDVIFREGVIHGRTVA